MVTKQIIPTKRSQQLEKLAQELLQNCPGSLGQEILIVGSVGLGIADDESDLDLELWVNELPPPSAAQKWLESRGAAHLIIEQEAQDNDVVIIFQYRNVWVETSWQKINEKEALVDEMLAGESTNRLKNTRVFNILNNIVLRTTGVIYALQQKLTVYPETLQRRIIQSASEFWRYPHRVEMLWGLAKRKEVFGLMTWIQADVSDALRILFAINQQWEIDWKHINQLDYFLTQRPSQLESRIAEIFIHQNLLQRVVVTQQLILDVLKLMPEKYDVSEAIANIQQSLAVHSSSTSR